MKEAIAERVVAEARRWIGTPYRHQASRRGVGCDCLGLVRGIWREIYGHEPEAVPAYAPDWAEAAGEDRLIEAARRHCREKVLRRAAPGDLLVFRWKRGHAAKHLGISVTADRFVHAYEGHAVMASALVPQWRARIAGVFAWPELSDRRHSCACHRNPGLAGDMAAPVESEAPGMIRRDLGPRDKPEDDGFLYMSR